MIINRKTSATNIYMIIPAMIYAHHQPLYAILDVPDLS